MTNSDPPQSSVVIWDFFTFLWKKRHVTGMKTSWNRQLLWWKTFLGFPAVTLVKYRRMFSGYDSSCLETWRCLVQWFLHRCELSHVEVFFCQSETSQTQQLRIRENPHGLQPHNFKIYVPDVKVVHGPKVGLRPGIWHPCYLVLMCLDCVIVEEPCVQWYICLTNIRTHIHLINIFIILI